MIRCTDKACVDGPAEDDQPRPRWALDGSMLCRRCTVKLEQRLAEIPARAQALRSVLGGMQAPQRDGSRHTKGNPPVPLNLAAHDHLAAIRDTLVSWVRLVADERSLRGPGRDDLEPLSAWLLSQCDWLTQQPWVDDLAEEMRDLSRVADGLTRALPQRYRLDAPCPVLGCGERQLTREDGEDHVWCDACGGVWTEDQYPWMVRVALADTKGSVTAREGAERAGVKPELFRQWVTRGKIRRLGAVDGVARYSASDLDAIIDAVAEESA